MLQRLNDHIGARKGNGRAIELILPEACFFIESKWLEIVPPEFKADWIRQMQNKEDLLNEIPDLGEETAETNIQNLPGGSTDQPVQSNRSSIRYSMARTENAGFARKMFSGTKELVPRLRYYLGQRNANGDLEYTKVKAKTQEHLVEFKCSARTKTEMNFYYKALEYIFYTNPKIFGDLGLQRTIPLGSPRRPVVDPKSGMHQKVLSVYMRNEEYFCEGPVIEYTGMEYVWEEIDAQFRDPYDVGTLP